MLSALASGRTNQNSVNEGNCSPEGSPVFTATPRADKPKLLSRPTARK